MIANKSTTKRIMNLI